MGASDFLEPGTAVMVNCAHGETRKNLVWEDHGAVVMVCAEDQFKRLKDGYPAPMPIGFRRDDVRPSALVGEAVPSRVPA